MIFESVTGSDREVWKWPFVGPVSPPGAVIGMFLEAPNALRLWIFRFFFDFLASNTIKLIARWGHRAYKTKMTIP